MRSCILAILLLAHVSVGLEAASDIEDAWLETGAHLVVDIGDSFDDEGGESLDSDNCDHCCHAISHLVAFTANTFGTPFPKTSRFAHISAASLYMRAGTAPPTPPPNA